MSPFPHMHFLPGEAGTFPLGPDAAEDVAQRGGYLSIYLSYCLYPTCNFTGATAKALFRKLWGVIA